MSPKISVIIPVYGVEKYIERCARSLFEQTLDSIEYIFIDDCTPDNSIEILKNVLEEYPTRKNQVQIHQMERNSGQAAVRKWGTLNAKGDYVIHCDSDDYVNIKMYKTLYDKAVEGDYDIVVCNYYTATGDVVKSEHIELPLTQYDRTSKMLNGLFPSYMWNKLIRRTIYQQGILWPKGNMWEDMAIMVQLMQKTDRVCSVDECLYYYEIRENSIVRSIDKMSVISKYRQIKENAEIVFAILDKNIYKDDIIKFKSRVRYHLTPCLLDADVWKVYNSAYPGLSREIMDCPGITLSQKVKEIVYKNSILRKILYRYFCKYAH